jgi:hypothetical protein
MEVPDQTNNVADEIMGPLQETKAGNHILDPSLTKVQGDVLRKPVSLRFRKRSMPPPMNPKKKIHIHDW